MFPATASSRYTLPNGREIFLVALTQSFNRQGLVIGRREALANGEYLNSLAREYQEAEVGFALLAPEGGFDGVNARFPHGAPEQLPEVTCTAEFISLGPVRDEAELCSQLVLIWFQDAFAGPEVLEAALARIDWQAQATDYSP